MTSVYETHMYYVNILLEEGEEVLQPEFGKSMDKINGYIKTQIPNKDAGSIFQDEDGTFGLFIDMGTKIIKGLEWQELGLCDSRCWYEWMSPETYQPKSKLKELTKESVESLIKHMYSNLAKVEVIKQDILNTIQYLNQFK